MGKVIKCSASLAFYHFSPTRLITHFSCVFFYISHFFNIGSITHVSPSICLLLLYTIRLPTCPTYPPQTVRTVLPAKSDCDVIFCLQSYKGLIIDRSHMYLSNPQDRINAQVIYRFALAQMECTS